MRGSIQDKPPRKIKLHLISLKIYLSLMQTIRQSHKTTNENSSEISKPSKNSQHSWQNIQGLTWIFKEDY